MRGLIRLMCSPVATVVASMVLKQPRSKTADARSLGIQETASRCSCQANSVPMTGFGHLWIRKSVLLMPKFSCSTFMHEHVDCGMYELILR